MAIPKKIFKKIIQTRVVEMVTNTTGITTLHTHMHNDLTCYKMELIYIIYYYIILHMNIPQTSSMVTTCVGVVTSKHVAHVIVVASTPVT